MNSIIKILENEVKDFGGLFFATAWDNRANVVMVGSFDVLGDACNAILESGKRRGDVSMRNDTGWVTVGSFANLTTAREEVKGR